MSSFLKNLWHIFKNNLTWWPVQQNIPKMFAQCYDGEFEYVGAGLVAVILYALVLIQRIKFDLLRQMFFHLCKIVLQKFEKTIVSIYVASKKILVDINNRFCPSSEQTRNCFGGDSRGMFEW